MAIEDNIAREGRETDGAVFEDSLKCNGTGSHDGIVMESGGVIDAGCPNYVEEDDVMDSIAEGYFG